MKTLRQPVARDIKRARRHDPDFVQGLLEAPGHPKNDPDAGIRGQAPGNRLERSRR